MREEKRGFPNQKIFPEDHADIRRRAKTETLEQIAGSYGVSRERIRLILKKYGEKVPKIRFTFKCAYPTCPKVLHSNMTKKYRRKYCHSCYQFMKQHPDGKGDVRRSIDPAKKCKREGCDKDARSKGYCAGHYMTYHYQTDENYRKMSLESASKWAKSRKGRKWYKDKYHERMEELKKDPVALKEYNKQRAAEVRAYYARNREKVLARSRERYRRKKMLKKAREELLDSK